MLSEKRRKWNFHVTCIIACFGHKNTAIAQDKSHGNALTDTFRRLERLRERNPLALFSNHNSASNRNSIAAERVIYRSKVNSNVWWMSKSGDLRNCCESAWKFQIPSLRGTPRSYFRFATHLSLLLYCFHLFSINNATFSFRDSKTLFWRKNMKWIHCGADRDWKMLFRAKLLIWFDFLSSRQVSLSFDPQKRFDFRAERDGSEKFSTHKRCSAFGHLSRCRFWDELTWKLSEM